MGVRSSLRALWTAPNLLTLARIPIAALTVTTLSSSWRFVFAALLLVTDVLDGRVARWLGQESVVGRVLDPVVDKMVAVVLVAALFPFAGLGIPYILLFFMREVLQVVLTPVALLENRGNGFIDPRTPSKTVTTLQFATLLLLLVPAPLAAATVIWIIAALSVLAMSDYTLAFYRAHGEQWAQRRIGVWTIHVVFTALFLTALATVFRPTLAAYLASVAP